MILFRWHKGQYLIPNHDKPYQVVFEAVRGYFHRADYGLDDISVTPGSCESRKNLYFE